MESYWVNIPVPWMRPGFGKTTSTETLRTLSLEGVERGWKYDTMFMERWISPSHSKPASTNNTEFVQVWKIIWPHFMYKKISCHAHLESVFLGWSPSIHTNQINRSIPFKHNRTLPLHPHHYIMCPLNTVYAYFLLHHLEVYWHDLTCIQKQSPFTIWWILFTRQTFHLLALNDQVRHEYTWCMCYKLIQGICFFFQIINSYENLIPSPGTVKFDAIFITSVFPSHHHIPHLSSDKNLRDPMCVFFYRCTRGLGWVMRCPCSAQVGWWASKRLRVYPKRPHGSH